MLYAGFFGDGGMGSALSTILFILFIFLYPKLMLWQMIYKLETDLKKLEEYSKKAEAIVLMKASKKPNKKIEEAVKGFLDFFVIEPVSLDPYGIIKKIEHVSDEAQRRFEYFVDTIAPDFNKEEKANLMMGLIGALGSNQIYKIVRHYVITVKKTSNLQIAMVLQMSMPMIMKFARAQVAATKALSHGVPIGDSIGPAVVASFKTKPGKEISKDVLVSQEKIERKTVYMLKAKGPGSRLGKLGVGVQKVIKQHRIDHIITIDAAGKLEGEKTGVIAEGVGVAIGGIGVDKSQIEELAVQRNIPLDAIAIKQSPVEASIPMKVEIFNSLPRAADAVKRLVKESKHKHILIVGVGNTSGIGNTSKSLKKVPELLKKDWQKQKKPKKKRMW